MGNFKLYQSQCLILLLVLQLHSAFSQNNIVTIIDASMSEEITEWLEDTFLEAQSSSEVWLKKFTILTSLETEESAEKNFCKILEEHGASVILDLTDRKFTLGQKEASRLGIPYIHVQISIHQWMELTLRFLRVNNATDAAFVFASESHLEQGVSFLTSGFAVLPAIVFHKINENATRTLQDMRPTPSSLVIVGNTDEVTALFQMAAQKKLTKGTSPILVVTDVPREQFDLGLEDGANAVTVIALTKGVCCAVRHLEKDCNCDDLNIPRETTLEALIRLARALNTSGTPRVKGTCGNPPEVAPSTVSFYKALQEEVSSLWPGAEWDSEEKALVPKLELSLMSVNSSGNVNIGTWSTGEGLHLVHYEYSPIKPNLTIGSVIDRPWLYREKTEKGEQKYGGYNFKLVEKLREKLGFNYVFKLPKDSRYGSKLENGSWDGLVGELYQGETDMIVAPLTMTSERAEVIDFVTPYFDMSGISIMIRRTEPERHLFKFTQVMTGEVWAMIFIVVVTTAIATWLLDRFSPYSAPNTASSVTRADENREEDKAQGEISSREGATCKVKSLIEYVWFAVTSFTFLGGGVAPKAPSGRILAIAYWIFVVLMLASFTANLAALLTVERMQTAVNSLEELAGQSKIKYTVLKSSSTEQYFQKMAAAEEEIFHLWRNVALHSPAEDQSKYRVWDYPVREQYKHILRQILDAGPENDTSDASEKVLRSKKGLYAFMDDTTAIQYHVHRSCLLVEVGEPFAVQPYAIAVQQGSHLKDEISRAILTLQKERFFEELKDEFWNVESRKKCTEEDSARGITLYSLGGVFILTLIGIVVSLVALLVEKVRGCREQQDVNEAVKILVESINMDVSPTTGSFTKQLLATNENRKVFPKDEQIAESQSYQMPSLKVAWNVDKDVY